MFQLARGKSRHRVHIRLLGRLDFIGAHIGPRADQRTGRILVVQQQPPAILGRLRVRVFVLESRESEMLKDANADW